MLAPERVTMIRKTWKEQGRYWAYLDPKAPDAWRFALPPKIPPTPTVSHEPEPISAYTSIDVLTFHRIQPQASNFIRIECEGVVVGTYVG